MNIDFNIIKIKGDLSLDVLREAYLNCCFGPCEPTLLLLPHNQIEHWLRLNNKKLTTSNIIRLSTVDVYMQATIKIVKYQDPNLILLLNTQPYFEQYKDKVLNTIIYTNCK